MTGLLDPVTLGPVTARNRIVFGPHETNLARRRSISARHVAYYRRRAAGGTGVVVTEEASVHPSDWPYERAPLAAECADGWAAVAAACHQEGALVVAGLGHAGGQGSSAYSQAPLWAPSPVPEVASREVPKAMEPADIAAVVAGFADAAATAVAAGCDGVEVNAGQHSLLRQFLSGLTNHRGDAWGTDRARFAREVLAAVRAAVPRAVLGLRLCCDELAPWAGLVPDTTPGLAAELAGSVDYLVVVRGSIYTVSATRPDTHTPAGFNAGLIRAVRAAVDGRTPVVGQGSVVDPAMAEAWVADGTADLVEMTRAQIADAELAAKVAAGDRHRVRPCIRCNQWCQVRDNRNPLVSCVGDPASGYETREPALVTPAPSPQPRPVLVVGAGPAGLECARVAATAGHRVRVLEARAAPGGMVAVAATAAGRSALAALTDWLAAECRTLGVEVETGARADAAVLAAHDGPVVVCTGSRPGRPTYRIDEGAVVVDAPGALDGQLPDGPVVVWDPVGGPVGVSLAEHLAVSDRHVTVVTPDLVVGQELARSGDLAPANARLQQAGVRLRRRSLLRSVGPAGAEVEDRFTGSSETLDAAVVVDAGHRLPADDLWAATGGRADRAGDAVAPRGIGEAVLEGRRAALDLDRPASRAGGSPARAATAGPAPTATGAAVTPTQVAHP